MGMQVDIPIEKSGVHVENAEDDEGVTHTLMDIMPDWEKPWYRVPHLLKLNLLLVVMFITNVYNGFDNSLIGSLQAIDTWNDYFNTPNGAILGFASNCLMIGSICALPFISFILDGIGRVRSIMLGLTILIIGVLVQGTARNFGQYTGGRLITGFGNAIACAAAPLLVAETAYPSHRPYMTGFSSCFYNVGSLACSWISFGVDFWHPTNWQWRAPILLQLIFPVIQFSFIWMAPESPRWYVAKGKYERAREMLLKWHGGGNEQLAGRMVDWELKEIEAGIEGSRMQNQSGWIDWFRTKQNFRRFLIIIMTAFIGQLSIPGITSYLPKVLIAEGITSSTRQLLINSTMGITSLFYGLVGVVLIKPFGRKTIFLFSMISTSILFSLFTIFTALNEKADYKNKAYSNTVLAFLYIYGIFYTVCLTAIPMIYLTEILPYTMRAKGIVVQNFFVCALIVFNQFVTPVALDTITWKFYCIFDVVMIIYAIIIWFLFPETRGLSLDEMATVFGDAPAELQANMRHLADKTVDGEIEGDSSSA